VLAFALDQTGERCQCIDSQVVGVGVRNHLHELLDDAFERIRFGIELRQRDWTPERGALC